VTPTAISVDAAQAASTPGAVFPVFVDPDVLNDKVDYTYVDTLYPTTSYYNNTPFEHVGYISKQYAGDGDHVTRSFWTMATSNLSGDVVTSASFNATDEWSFSCSPRRVDLWLVGPISASTTWNVQPTLMQAPVNPPAGFLGEWPPPFWPTRMSDWWNSTYGDGA
jgi:hypothetical protein